MADPMTPEDEQRLRELIEMHPALLQPKAIELRHHLLNAREDVTAARAELERLRAKLADANRFLDQRRNDVAAWRTSYERLFLQTLRRHHAWQSAKRGRKQARAELATVRREAHRDRLAVDGALDRIESLLGDREQAETGVDRLTEQVRVLAGLIRRTGAEVRCSGHPDNPDSDCATCRDAGIVRAALDETEAGQ